MKQLLLICSLQLCIANIGYSKNEGITVPPPPSREQQPTSSCFVGLNINHPTVKVWFTASLGTVEVKVTNTAGDIIEENINTGNVSNLTIDVSAWGHTYYKVCVTSAFGKVIAEL